MIDLSGVDDPIRLFLSAGPYSREGFLSTQQTELNLLKRADWEASFGERRAHTILAEHVWEHLTLEEGIEAARTCFEFLQPGGLLRLAVPDGLHPSEEYQQRVAINGPGPAADHKVLYTYRTLPPVFEAAGFTTRLLEFWDSTPTFHATDWDPAEGLIFRSRRFDPRNQDGTLGFTSLILDARKPAGRMSS
jgi:predicted SAM-dependent methyltransferase